MKIIDSVWFTAMQANATIGIVLGNDETTEEYKAYIGTGAGRSKEEDEKFIATWGAKFPLDAAMLLIKGSVKP